MAANLFGHPARDDAVNYPPDLTVQAGVQLKPLAQPHLLGQCNHQMPVVSFGQLLGQLMAQDLGPAIDTGWTDPRLARKGNGHMDFAIRAVQ